MTEFSLLNTKFIIEVLCGTLECTRDSCQDSVFPLEWSHTSMIFQKFLHKKNCFSRNIEINSVTSPISVYSYRFGSFPRNSKHFCVILDDFDWNLSVDAFTLEVAQDDQNATAQKNTRPFWSGTCKSKVP